MGRSSDSRERLLASAHALFRGRGFEAVGVAELCSAAEINKGSFYHFFSSKRELLLEVLASAWDETGLLTDWESQIPSRPLIQLRRYLQDLFAYHYADREKNGRVHGSLIGNLAVELGARDPEVAKRVNELFTRETAVLAKLLAAASDAGEVSVGEPERAAETLVACLHGLLMLAKVRNSLEVLPANETELLRLAGIIQPWLS